MKKKIAAGATLIEDLVAGSGSWRSTACSTPTATSARSDKRPEHFIMSRSRAPALRHGADLMGSTPTASRCAARRARASSSATSTARSTAPGPTSWPWCTASPSVIPFGVTKTRLRPVYHMGSFLWTGAPVWDIRQVKADNDVRARPAARGRATSTLGSCTCVLMQGHGMTVVGDSIQEAVFRAIYTKMNARLQLDRAARRPDPVRSESEGKGSTASNRGTSRQPCGDCGRRRRFGHDGKINGRTDKAINQRAEPGVLWARGDRPGPRTRKTHGKSHGAAAHPASTALVAYARARDRRASR